MKKQNYECPAMTTVLYTKEDILSVSKNDEFDNLTPDPFAPAGDN